MDGPGSGGDIQDVDESGNGGRRVETEQCITEADMYRASLLVHNGWNLSAKRKRELRKWLAARPGGMNVKTSAVDWSDAHQSRSDVCFPTQSVRLLESLDVLLNSRSTLYEGDIFSVLWQSPFVVRSFEFALADGALDCANEFSPGTTYADRFWEMGRKCMGRTLLLFDGAKARWPTIQPISTT